jgi:superfamily II DNA or RNA helicase
MTAAETAPDRFAPGTLVRARDREWVVLPDSNQRLLRVRPLGGSDEEITGILPTLEPVRDATFDWPDPARIGDHRSAVLLRDALRLGFRSSAGPFRSFGSIAVEPRPYQLVPLLMALRQDVTRLLIADDVGIGKTVEALLIAREVLENGTATRLAVLCPPHLAEQWQREMVAKFHINAELVLPSTAAGLERRCRIGQSLFDLHPHVVVSTDFIKAERRRAEFLRTCPELVIIDEAHSVAADPNRRGARHQRHALASGLAADPDRHLILVTATPHSGDDGAFRSLIALCDPTLADLPEDLSGPGNEPLRRKLATVLVQRRRSDIERYLSEGTTFPRRDAVEETYTLHPDYRALFDRALAYARETVADASGGQHRQRVRWWAALGLLRSLSSSPAAAAATLRTRAKAASTATVEEADAVSRAAVMDTSDPDSFDDADTLPGADPIAAGPLGGEGIGQSSDPEERGDSNTAPTDEPGESGRVRRRLLDMARLAEGLAGGKDHKLTSLLTIVDQLIADGLDPIVFCRYIPTAAYVADQLRSHVGARAEVGVVTGEIPPGEREKRVDALAGHNRRILVATDCLSEGINLQDHFTGVVHYDLAWSPVRHEQREGRVDRFGQPGDVVKTVTFYGADNPVDGIVLEVLLRKHQQIRRRLGVAVPVPDGSTEVMEAIFEGLLLRERSGRVAGVEQLTMFDEFIVPRRRVLHSSWDAAADREKRSQSMYAQAAIRVDEVSREVAAARAAVGSGRDVATFTRAAVTTHGGGAVTGPRDALEITLVGTPAGLRDAVGLDDRLRARFDLPVRDGETYLDRTHPFVEGLASYVLTSALDGLADSPARRSGAIRTSAITRRTVLLLLRYRFDVVTTRGESEQVLLAEDCETVAYTGTPDYPQWLKPTEVERLLAAAPTGNIAAEQASRAVAHVVEARADLDPHLATHAQRRAADQLEAHRRVRTESGRRGVRYRVSAHLPVDVLGLYVLLPTPAGGAG